MVEPSIDVVLPCLDESSALPKVLDSLPAGYRAIVVDNGSTDNSPEIARAFGALVINEARRGYGAAVNTGLLAATAPIVVTCDADGSFDLSQIDRVVDPVRENTADLVMGRRRSISFSAWPVHARIANTVLSARLRALTGVPIHDLGPLRAARRDVLLGLELQDRRSGYPLELFLRAAHKGLKIAEVDVDYHPRAGKSKVTGTLRGTLTAVADMSRQLKAVEIS